MSYIQNSLQKLESLENGYQLYGLNIQIPQAQPGQVLQVGTLEIPIFNHQNNQLQIITRQTFNEHMLAQHKVKIAGEAISNNQLKVYAEAKQKLVIVCKNDFCASAFFLVKRIRQLFGDAQAINLIALILIEADEHLPFRAVPSQIIIPKMPDGVIASAPLLEDLGISCRIIHPQGLPGCFDGSLSELLAQLEIAEPIIRFA